MVALRWWRHGWAALTGARRVFAPPVLAGIEAAIREAESRHGGEIRFAIEAALGGADLWHGLTPRERALQVFASLGVWDTAANNGVLIYVLLADRDVEIVADRGLGGRVSDAEWQAVCRAMEDRFRAGQPAEASVQGVRAVGELIARHFPKSRGDRNEQPDQPVLL